MPLIESLNSYDINNYKNKFSKLNMKRLVVLLHVMTQNII